MDSLTQGVSLPVLQEKIQAQFQTHWGKLFATQGRRGATFAGVAFLCLTLMDFINKSAMGELSGVEVYFYANLFGFLLCLIYSKATKTPVFFNRNIPFHISRAILNFISGLAIMLAFAVMPVSLSYTVIFLSPTIVILISHFWMKERATSYQVIGLSIGFIGVLMILRPSPTTFQMGYIFALIGALGFAINANIVRRYGQNEQPLRFITFSSLAGILLSFYPALFQAHAHSLGAYGLLFVGAVLLLFSNLLMNFSLQHTKLSTISSLQYTQLIWSFLFEFALLGRVPVLLTILGAGMIIMGGLVAAKIHFLNPVAWKNLFRSKQV